ncbi:LysR substrate-binding domain-containing protein [Roseomonas sp. NAR14]|uniref:LysR substrate-binding domain-containing protein n=1 Tax=Roseomonas acroporae TaxID=2937791 RepID=A0A9X1Y9L3_9PROT|nr:LysR substrate-binding domain-containing protein [Roseomonas acroporae]MCK8786063.1 LysR substrate-binding domain-containing protein [Roseomonas acroporae]
MDLRDLSYFTVIAELEHLGRAAERLHLSQPALTKCLRRLEASLGATLFRREGRGIRLTPAGGLLLARARRLGASAEEYRREVRDFAEGAVGHLRIGTGATTAECLLPGVCRELLGRHPGITFEIFVGMNDVLRTKLRDGELDLVLGPLVPDDEAEFARHLLTADEVVVTASRDHPLFAQPPSLARLAGHAWVLASPRVDTHRWLVAVFAAAGLPPPRIQIVTNSISALPRLIASTQLLSFMSRRNLGPGGAGMALREVRLAETTMLRQFGVVHRRDGYLPPAAQHLLRLLKTAVPEEDAAEAAPG